MVAAGVRDRSTRPRGSHVRSVLCQGRSAALTAKRTRLAAWAVLALAVSAQLLSGAAAIINQIVWQRSLVVYLAGSEAISSMIVVLVFMLGLGAGGLWMGRTANRVSNPARALGAAEFGLAAANLIILALLALAPGESMRRVQQVALSFGVPLRLVYSLVSSAVLLGPCFLMGITSPLMSEVAQRQLRLRDQRFLVVLFFSNTLGSFAGGLATGFLLMPVLGQRSCLAIAIVLNLLAGAAAQSLSRCSSPTERTASGGSAVRGTPLRLLASGFALGLLGLAYEMYLYRVVALCFEPKPYTFATVLCLYLLFWAVGVLCAQWVPWSVAQTLTGTVALVLWAAGLAGYPWPAILGWRQALLAMGFWVPCLGFGAAFGQLVIRLAVNWGNDVGRFYGWNTIGGCCGIVLGVLVGYRAHPTYLVLMIGLGYIGLACAAIHGRNWARHQRFVLGGAVALTLGLWTAELLLLHFEQEAERSAGNHAYYGPEGVIEIRGNGAMFWNGLGHAPLSRANDHVGSHNWLLGAIPLLAHAPHADLDALVIGLGGGTTVGTLVRSTLVRGVDVYDIVPALKQVLADYPEGTLNVGTSPKVTLWWQDGRTGLALTDKRYDVVTQQPLYLKQAGSSTLLSREYMQIVRSRLKRGGIFCIYSNAQGHEGQALMVRQTAREVFRYGESMAGGYMLIVSDEPFAFDAQSIEGALAAAAPGDVLVGEVRTLGVEKLAALLDRPRLEWEGSPMIVTDDRPVVEYPDIADWLVAYHARARGPRP